jgi:hypothetical protein
LQQINPSPVTTPIQANTPMENALVLKDIHLPEQITNYPVAYGWWLLAIIILMVTMFLLVKMRQRAKLKHHQQQALKQLKNSPNMGCSEVIALLKWAAIQYFSRAQLAKLYGEQLQQFLMQKLPIKHQQKFKQLSEQAFYEQYKEPQSQSEPSNDSSQSFQQAAILWLTYALPPKTQAIEAVSANNQVGGKV